MDVSDGLDWLVRGVKGTICVSCSSSVPRSRFNFVFFSWADLKDMMRQAGEVTYTDAHQRMVSIRYFETTANFSIRVKIEVKSVLLTGMHFMLPKRSLMVKNVTVSSFLE